MVTPLASRFAVLPIDDDGDTSRKIKAKTLNKKQEQTKPHNISKKQDCTKSKQSVPKSKPKPKGETNKKKASQEQWIEWKQKDEEFVDGHYEEELQQAMLLSKLDFEEKKDYYDQIKKTSEEEKKTSNKKHKKSNKAQPMSLSQFNQMSETSSQPEIMNGVAGKEVGFVNGNFDADTEFFDRIKSEAKVALKSEKVEEQRKVREPMIDELISIAQYQDRLQKCDEEISRLKDENNTLKLELVQVKSRNKKLCRLMMEGEMKDKAAVLVEVDKLNRVRDELSSEVESLAAQLEQEKSKVRALTGKDKKKRTDSK